MAMMARDAWTDERLDDLKGSVDAGFGDNREEFRAVRTEIQGVRTEIQGVRTEIQGVRAETAALSRSVQQFTWSVVVAMLAGFLSVLATILVQA
jgi:Protein of unknown function (DUF1685)